VSGPCHGLGGAAHRCDGPPALVSVSFNGKPASVYRWCGAAVADVRRMAQEQGEKVQIARVCADALVCEAAKVDGIVCAPDECDRESGVRS
jgi:hypothetical protein